MKTAKPYRFADNEKSNKEASEGWDYYEVTFICDGRQFSALINIANSENGGVFYDLTKIKMAPTISNRYIALMAQSPSHLRNHSNTKVSQNSFGVNSNDMQNGEKNSQSSAGFYGTFVGDEGFAGKSSNSQAVVARGIRVAEYDPTVEGDRVRAVNTFADQKFGLDGYDLSQLDAEGTSRQAEIDNQYSMEYKSTEADEDLLDLIDKVEKKNFKDNDFAAFEVVSSETAARIKRITDVDVTGWKVKIEARQIKHILKVHGEFGATDKSMKNKMDIAKMEYVIANAENVEHGGFTKAYTNF